MNAGVYLHVPFCRSRCSYCDFATGMYESSIAEAYVRALISEISEHSVGAGLVPARAGQPHVQPLQQETVDTIYFGGGTPSLLTTAQIETILEAVRRRFAVTDDAEITLEINPGDGGTSAASKRDGHNPNDNDQSDRLDAALVRPADRSEFFWQLKKLG